MERYHGNIKKGLTVIERVFEKAFMAISGDYSEKYNVCGNLNGSGRLMSKIGRNGQGSLGDSRIRSDIARRR